MVNLRHGDCLNPGRFNRPSAATASWLLLATYGGYTIDMVQLCTWEDPCLGEPPITK